MEPLTHFMVGACMARAGFNRKTALATATMTLAAEAPDLDVLTEFGGRVFGFEHHRGITHSFVGVPLVAALVVLVMFLGHRWNTIRRGGGKTTSPPRWRVLFWLACLAALSHLLLDFTNNYGVRPFAPFSYKWYSWDIVFIVEPVLWGVLLLGLVLPSLFAVINQEIRSTRQRPPRGRVGAIFALAGVLVVWAVRDYEHRRALAAMDALTYQGEVPVRRGAFPYMLNPFRWYAVVETRRFYESTEVDSLRPEVDPQNQATVHYKEPETPVTLAAKRSYLGRVYLDWAAYPVIEVEQLSPPEAGYLVRLYDMRFMYPGRTGRRVLGAWVQLDPELNVVVQSFGIRAFPAREGQPARVIVD